MRVTPKISDRPADTRNSDEAEASPFSSWMMTEAKVMKSYGRHPPSAHLPHRRGRPGGGGYQRLRQFAGRIFFTSSSDGSASLPSTKRHSVMTPLPSFR